MISEVYEVYIKHMNYFTDDGYYQNQKQIIKEKYAYTPIKEKLPELSLEEQSKKLIEYS